jgi:dUTP pyrophosphatase
VSTIRVAKLYDDAKLPTRKHPTDAGMDLYYYSDIWEEISPMSYSILNTGITIEIPDGYVGLIWPKSRSNYLIGGGVIDSSYQGEILVKVMNVSKEYLMIGPGEAIAQLLIQPIYTPRIALVSTDIIHENKTERNKTGGIATQYTNQNPFDFIESDTED